MAYSYPPPFMNTLMSETVSGPPVPVVNFSIPPPGFRHSCTEETWHADTYRSHPQSPLPPQEHSVLHCQVNAPSQEVHAHMSSDSLWLKDWLQKRRMTHTHSHQKCPAVPLKVRVSHLIFFVWNH
jgi:hypothetical protein